MTVVFPIVIIALVLLAVVYDHHSGDGGQE